MSPDSCYFFHIIPEMHTFTGYSGFLSESACARRLDELRTHHILVSSLPPAVIVYSRKELRSGSENSDVAKRRIRPRGTHRYLFYGPPKRRFGANTPAIKHLEASSYEELALLRSGSLAKGIPLYSVDDLLYTRRYAPPYDFVYITPAPSELIPHRTLDV